MPITKAAVGIKDGANPAIEASVRDLANANSVDVTINDASGNPITSFGGGTVSISQTGTANDVDVVSSVLPTGAATLTEQQIQTASLSVMDDWDEVDRAKVNPIVGQAGVQGGTGIRTALTQRVTIATDDIVPAAQSGTWTVQPGNTPNSTPWLVNPTTAFGKTITYVPVAQGAAGTTVLAAASASNKHKVVGAMLVISATGTLKFTDGAGDLTGPMALAANGGFVLNTSATPLIQTTTTNTALSIVTTVGAVNGVVAILTEP